MLQFRDRRYYAEFEDRVTTFSFTSTPPAVYGVGDIVQFGTPAVYYEWDPADGMTLTADAATDEPLTNAGWVAITDLPQLGYYQFITLEEIINNYMVLYTGDDTFGSSMRRKVEAFAQRAIQEFSYNTFKVKSLESVINDSFVLPLPQDYVDLVNISYVDQYGTERWLIQRLDSGAPSSALQEDDAEYIYDDQGNLIFDNLNSKTLAGLNNDPTDDEQYDGSSTIDRYDSFAGGSSQRAGQRENLLFTGNRGSYATYGKRFYQDSQLANMNGTYVVMEDDGVIYLEPSLAGETVTIRYVSDGLGADISEIKVHKLAEQAIYDSVYYEMIQRSNTIPANEKERAKRRMRGKMREAKLRLSPIGKRELLQVLRGQGVWIKT